jgi:hypothetical protein
LCSLTVLLADCEALQRDRNRQPEEVEVVSVTPRRQPDSCLGIAQEDEVCALVVTSGYEVVLRLDSREYIYRTDEAGTIVRWAILILYSG